MKTKTEYQTDLDTMLKAYQTLDNDYINNIKIYLHDKYDLDIADNMVMSAEYKYEQYRIDTIFG